LKFVNLRRGDHDVQTSCC